MGVWDITTYNFRKLTLNSIIWKGLREKNVHHKIGNDEQKVVANLKIHLPSEVKGQRGDERKVITCKNSEKWSHIFSCPPPLHLLPL